MSKLMNFVRYDARAKPKPWRGQLFEKHKEVRCEIKLDGHRMTIWKEKSGIFAVSRKTTAANLWPDVERCLDARTLSKILEMPIDTCLDGELWQDDLPAAEVVTSLKNETPLRFSPFSVPVFAGQDLRHQNWGMMSSAFAGCGFEMPGQHLTWRHDDLQEFATELGIEGFVIKVRPYANWWKVKPLETLDVEVAGFEPGEGKHEGRLGALHIQVYDKLGKPHYIGKVGIGNDDDWRDLPSEEVMGRVCEVGFEGSASKGKLRFPRFIRWRDDKEPIECGTDQC